jgi:small subunit ribosomal protein S16
MPTKIRLQRKGKKGRPFYHIVIVDSRTPRDGKFIERIGQYNPLTIPATIVLDSDRAVHWLQTGAQPSDTCRAILAFKGVMFKHHLMKGVAKGALTAEQAEAKFQTWLQEKESKIKNQKSQIDQNLRQEKTKRLKEEGVVREEVAKAVAKKRSDLAAALAEKNADATVTVAEETAATVEEPVAVAEEVAPIVEEQAPVAEDAAPVIENTEEQESEPEA